MKQVIAKIIQNEQLTENIFKIIFEADTSDIKASGQFVNIKIDGCYLRRPISIFDYDDSTITVIIKKVGKGTEKLNTMKKGQYLDILIGLGNGFNTEISGKTPLVIGGGVGIPPLYNLCKKLINEGKTPSVILGFNNDKEIICYEEFKNLAIDIIITTVDGSCGIKGFVTDAMKLCKYSYFYTCGPEAMFRAIDKKVLTEGQYSFESRMGCGFGACMGCSCKTISGYKRICKDGPVMERKEIIWES